MNHGGFNNDKPNVFGIESLAALSGEYTLSNSSVFICVTDTFVSSKSILFLFERERVMFDDSMIHCFFLLIWNKNKY